MENNSANFFCKLFLCILLLSGGVSALTIDLEYPSLVQAQEPFSVTLTLSEPASINYAVKIDMTDANGKRIGQILNHEKWTSTYYYIDDALAVGSSTATFQLKALSASEQASLVVKLKDDKGKTQTFPAYTLSVAEGAQQPEEKKTNEVPVKEEMNNVEESKTQAMQASTPSTIQVPQNAEEHINTTPSIIHLQSPQDIKSKKQLSLTSLTEHPWLQTILFAMAVLVLFMIGKKKTYGKDTITDYH